LHEQVVSIQRQLANQVNATGPGIAPELARVVAAWSTLPREVKARILADLEGHRSKAA
jgi:hypothetical protein